MVWGIKKSRDIVKNTRSIFLKLSINSLVPTLYIIIARIKKLTEIPMRRFMINSN